MKAIRERLKDFIVVTDVNGDEGINKIMTECYEELERMNSQYLSAVQGRRDFRKLYREARQELQELKEENERLKGFADYYASVLDEVTGGNWRKSPDHVEQKLLEAINPQ